MKKILFPIIAWIILSGMAGAQSLTGLKVYINPGHGGFDSNDRNIPIPPFAAGDTAGFWESKSNLVKGLYLRKLLETAGAQVIMSRVQNRTADDRSLSAIAEEANANQVDFMISVHSNAYNPITNYTLMLFHGWNNNPILPQSMALANIFWDNLFSNQATQWSSSSRKVFGDKSFADPSWNGYGVLRPLTVPGLISEGSFHEYVPEAYRLMNREYKQMEAWHLFRGFCSFYGGNPGNKGKIAGVVRDKSVLVTSYSYISGSNDQWPAINGATVTLQPGNLVYQTDNLNNGFFLFDELPPGNYQLTIEAGNYQTKTVEPVRVDSAKVTYTLVFSDLLSDSPTVDKMEKLVPYGDSGIKLFPNPASGRVTILKNGAIGTCRYRISTTTGLAVREGMLDFFDSRAELNISDLQNGFYFLSVSGNPDTNSRLLIFK